MRFRLLRFPMTWVLLANIVFFLLTLSTARSQQLRQDDLMRLLRQHSVPDPTLFVLSKLRTHRIVMIADFGHGVSLYYQVVLSSLDAWAANWEGIASGPSESGLPRKLFLVLEMDSVGVNGLNRYFSTGNPYEVIQPQNFVGNQFTTATLEFYDHLKRFAERVGNLNRSRPPNDQLLFGIIGPEKVVDLTTWTQKSSQDFFVNERDEFSASQIQRLLEKESDAKAIIYYGGAHLEREKSAKLGRNQGFGYYMAHYLSEDFSSHGGVYTCGQLAVNAIPWLDPAFAAIGRTFAIDSDFLEGAAISASTSLIPVDGIIFHSVKPRTPRHISAVPSVALVDLALNNLACYNDSSKQYYRYILFNCLYYLSKVAAKPWTPESFSSVSSIDSAIRAWSDWRKSTKLDFVRDISTLSLFRQIVDSIASADAKQSTQFRDVLAQFTGFTVWMQPGSSNKDWREASWQAINKYRTDIVIENLIHLLWVGSPAEVRDAIAALKKETGQAFVSPKDWTTWWNNRVSE